MNKMEFTKPLEEALSNLPYQERERLVEKLEEFSFFQTLMQASQKILSEKGKKILRKSREKEEVSKNNSKDFVGNLEKIAKSRFVEFGCLYDSLSKVFGFEKTQEILYATIEDYEKRNPDEIVQIDIWKNYINRIISGK